MNKSLSFLSALAILGLLACADPTGGGGGGSGGGTTGGSSESRGNARAMSVSNTGVAVVAQSYGGVSGGSYYNFTGNLQVSTDSGATWATVGDPAVWSKVRVSTDGTKLVALAGAAGGAYSPSSGPTPVSQAVYSSTDGGTTWQWATGLPTKYYYGMQASPDGTKVFVSSSSMSGTVHYYSADSGATFTALTMPSTSPLSGQTITSVMPAGISNTHLYVTASYSVSGAIKNTLFAIPHGSFATGSDWVNFDPANTGTPPNTSIRSVSASDDGTKVLAVDSTSGSTAKLYLGTLSSGSFTFTELTSLEATVQNYQSTVLSSDGTQIFLVARGAAVSPMTMPPTYGSGSLKKAAVTDTSWTTLSAFGTQSWSLLAISPNGDKILASDGSPSIHRSTDGGTTVANHTFHNHSAGTPGTPPTITPPSGGGGGSGSGGAPSVTLTGNGLVTSFGSSGMVTTPSLQEAGNLIYQSGSLYLLGSGSWTDPKGIYKFDGTTGALTTSYGTSGKLELKTALAAALGLADPQFLQIANMVSAGSGSLYVGGVLSYGASMPYSYKSFVAKYTAGGQLDTSFHSDGVLDVTPYRLTGNEAAAIQIASQSDGVAVYLGGYFNSPEANILKFNASGIQVGTTLNIWSSLPSLPSNNSWSYTRGFLTDASNNLYMQLSSYDQNFNYYGSTAPTTDKVLFVKMTVSSSGAALDTTFGSSGFLTVDLLSLDAGQIHRDKVSALDSSGNLYLATVGFTNGSTSLTQNWWNPGTARVQKYSSAGVLDTSFSTSASAAVGAISSFSGPQLTIGGAGLYVSYTNYSTARGNVLKLSLSTGAVDQSFGTNGINQPISTGGGISGMVYDGTNLLGTMWVTSVTKNVIFKKTP